MGLTKEVRDFFYGKIVDVLDKKLAEIKKTVNRDYVALICLEKMCDKAGIALETLDELQVIQEQIKLLNSQGSNIQDEIRRKLRKANIEFNYYRHDVNYADLKSMAVEQLEDDVLMQYYPDVGPQIEKILHIKDDVYGAILLATTERKLVATLTKLLTNYGGDISELLELIPEQEE